MSSRNGRNELFEQVIAENRRLISAIARSYAPADSRDDLYQEILFQIWRSLDGFAGLSKISTWINRVALNTAIRFSQKAALRRQTMVPLEID